MMVPVSERQMRRLAPALGSLVAPFVVTFLVLGLWRIGADMAWAGDFPISVGLFSHWQVWISAAVAAHLGGLWLKSLESPQDEGPDIP